MSNLLLERSALMARHPLLPREYQQVEYIESTGTQWIDTGVYGSNDIELRLVGSRNSSSSNSGWTGARTNSTERTFTINVPTAVGTILRFGSFAYNTNDTSILLKIGEVASFVLNSTGYYINNTLITTIPEQSSFTTQNTLKLFGNGLYKSIMSIYSCQILQDGLLIRNFIPCYHKVEKTFGLYDTIGNVFYTNQGSGNFISASAV